MSASCCVREDSVHPVSPASAAGLSSSALTPAGVKSSSSPLEVVGIGYPEYVLVRRGVGSVDGPVAVLYAVLLFDSLGMLLYVIEPLLASLDESSLVPVLVLAGRSGRFFHGKVEDSLLPQGGGHVVLERRLAGDVGLRGPQREDGGEFEVSHGLDFMALGCLRATGG